MKRFIGFCMLASMIILPSMALAKEQIGIYVAPKFIGAWSMMNNLQTGLSASGITDEMRSLANIGDKTEMNFGGALAIGYDFKRNFDFPIRAEIEYAYLADTSASRLREDIIPNTDFFAKQSFQAQTLFVNAYFDFHNSTAFTPYIGAGLGVAFVGTKADFDFIEPTSNFPQSTDSQTETNFAWNVGAGIGYDINSMFTVDLGYRFASLGGATTKWTTEGSDPSRLEADNLYMHQVALGLRVNF